MLSHVPPTSTSDFPSIQHRVPPRTVNFDTYPAVPRYPHRPQCGVDLKLVSTHALHPRHRCYIRCPRRMHDFLSDVFVAVACILLSIHCPFILLVYHSASRPTAPSPLIHNFSYQHLPSRQDMRMRPHIPLNSRPRSIARECTCSAH
jgi:hypothetical protein